MVSENSESDPKSFDVLLVPAIRLRFLALDS